MSRALAFLQKRCQPHKVGRCGKQVQEAGATPRCRCSASTLSTSHRKQVRQAGARCPANVLSITHSRQVQLQHSTHCPSLTAHHSSQAGATAAHQTFPKLWSFCAKALLNVHGRQVQVPCKYAVNHPPQAGAASRRRCCANALSITHHRQVQLQRSTHRPPLTAYHLTPITLRPTLTAHLLPPTTERPLLTAHHSPITTDRPPLAAHHSQPITRSPSLATHHSPPTTHSPS